MWKLHPPHRPLNIRMKRLQSRNVGIKSHPSHCTRQSRSRIIIPISRRVVRAGTIPRQMSVIYCRIYDKLSCDVCEEDYGGKQSRRNVDKRTTYYNRFVEPSLKGADVRRKSRLEISVVTLGSTIMRWTGGSLDT